MKNKIHTLRVFLIALILVLSSILVSAGDFNIYNRSDESQTYFAINGTTGNTGIGISDPTTLLQLLNDKWISAKNYLGTGIVNMFKVSQNDSIELGATLNIGSFEFNEDSGLVTFVDMPVSSTPAAGTSESYVFKVDGDNIMTVYSEADGSGGVQNKRVGIGTITPQNTLNVIGAGNFTGNLYGGTVYSGGSEVLTSFTETDPYWTGNQSSYSTTAEILAFGYYNASDFVITDYFTKTDILGFSYYNLTDFDIADYFTSSEVLAFNYYNLSDFDIADYFTAAQILGFNYYNSTDFVITDYYTKTEIDDFGFYNITNFDINDYYTKTQVYNKTEVDGFSLSKWTDDLGDRGYTHLTNFTDDILWTAGFNATGDSRWLGVGEESDPLWTGNFSSKTGTGNVVYHTSPVLVTPTLGAASATSLTLTTDLAVEHGGTGASTLTDGGILLGSGTGAITPMAVLANGAIVVGDGTTDPVALTAFTSSTGDLIHEAGGLEADVSGYSNGLYGMLSGATVDIDTEAELETALGSINVIVSTELAAAETDPLWTGNFSSKTGTGNVVYSTSPTLVTPNIGAATAGGTLNMNNNAITNINWSGSDDGSGSGLDADKLDGSEKTAFQMDVSDSCSGENVIQTIAQDGTTGCYNTYSASDDLIDDITEWQDQCTNCVTDGDVVDTITASNYVRKSTWTDIDDYPTGCGAGTAVRIIGDTLTCINISSQGSETLDGYDSTFFMPLNTSVTGNFSFNGGWTEGGLSIIEGDIYAQQLFVYNISHINVSHLNINGSLLPQAGFDNQFDLGSSSLRWNELYLGGKIYAADWTNVSITESQISDLQEYYLKSNPFGFYNSTNPQTETDPLWTGNQSSYWNTGTDLDTVISDDEIAEGKIAFSTACAAGNHYYLDGNDLACEADDDTTYTASGTLLDLTGTTFSVNAGTLTTNKGCKFVTGTGIVCDQDYLTSFTETDPFWTGNFSNVAFINKANAFGAFNQSFNTNTLFVDATNDRVGIGTTVPTHELNVVGDANITGTLHVLGSVNATMFYGDGLKDYTKYTSDNVVTLVYDI